MTDKHSNNSQTIKSKRQKKHKRGIKNGQSRMDNEETTVIITILYSKNSKFYYQYMKNKLFDFVYSMFI
jgi:hypothetical protein